MTRSVVVLLAAALLAWFGSLGLRPLYKPDEARYGEIAREMAQSGDWVTPRLNGFKYFEKPPLQYWATAGAMNIFGERDWVARLWPALLAVAGIVLVTLAGNRLFAPPAGMLAAAVLAASPLYLLLGQFTTLDMGVSFFLSLAVFAFAFGQRDQTGARARARWMAMFWAACALATLSKGLIGVALPLATVALYVLLRREWRLLARLHLLRGSALFFAIALPWFAAAAIRNDEFLYFFFVQEHWLRYTTHLHHREHPAWFFLPVLAGGMAPSLLAVAVSWPASFLRQSGAAFSPRFFLGLWALVVFAFFSASGSKLPAYILPMLPALAVLAGDFLTRPHRSGMVLAQSLLVAAAGFLVGSQLDRIGSVGGPARQGLIEAYLPWLAAAATVLVATGALAAALAALKRTAGAVAAIALGTMAATLIAIGGHRTLAPAYSVADMTASLPSPAQARIFAVDAYDHSIPWSLRRTVTMVGYKDELEVPIAWEPEKFIGDLEGFRRAWMEPAPAYAFFAARDFERRRAELALPMQVVARGPQYVIVTKP